MELIRSYCSAKRCAESTASLLSKSSSTVSKVSRESDDELGFHLEHERWPEDNELPESGDRQNEVEE
jgi:hypothetical protein